MSLPSRSRRSDRLRRGCQAVVIVAAAAAVLCLAIERGFEQPQRLAPIWLLRAVQAFAVGSFVLWRLLGLALARRRLAYLRSYWLDFVLIGVGAAAVLVAFELLLAAGTIYVATMQLFLAVQLTVEVVRFHVVFSSSRLPPARLLAVSFLILIAAGTLLLMLPKATNFERIYAYRPGWHVINCLFTATSATCVTGLVVYDTGSDFSLFGQTVILALIQLGGLGIMIFGTVFGMLLGRQLTIRESLLMQDVLSQQTLGEISRMVKFILATTFILEGLGAVALYPMWDPNLVSQQLRWFYSIFHAVSAFCNAGFALQADSLIHYRQAWQVYGVIMPLIVLGGLGFPVLYDLAQSRWQRLRLRSQRHRSSQADRLPASPLRARGLSLHSRIVLLSSVLLIVLGAAMLWIGETESGWEVGRFGQGQSMRTMSPGQRALAALFQSVTARTAGFATTTVEPGALSSGSHFLLCMLMFVGGSPGSTAGGIKTVSLAVMILAVLATLRRRDNVEAFGRTIPPGLVGRAAAIITLALGLVSLAVLVLSYSESAGFLEVLFETVSAFGTVGLSTGLTPDLTLFGRCVIIVLMFVGRIGPLTLLVALAGRERAIRYEYPTESVMLG